MFQRGLNHGLAFARLTPEQVQEIEPHVRCLAGIKVPSTGIVNYWEVSAKYLELIKSNGGTMQSGAPVERLHEVNGTQVIQTPQGEFEAGFVINCAGLFSDRVTRFSGFEPGAKIIPFRGEYYRVGARKAASREELSLPSAESRFSIFGCSFYAHD